MVSRETDGLVTDAMAREIEMWSHMAVHIYPSTCEARLVLVDDPTQSREERERVGQYVSAYGLAQVYRLDGDAESNPVERAQEFTQELADTYPNEPVVLGAFSRRSGVQYYFPRGYFGEPGWMPPRKYLRMRDGAVLGYREYPAETDTIVVLLHGATTHDGLYAPLARFLAARNLGRVIALTLRGHGGASLREGDVDYMGQCEDDVADVIMQLRAQQHAGAKFIVLGHSLGGGLALRFASGEYGALADGYILLAPYLGLFTPLQKIERMLMGTKVHWVRGAALTMVNGFGLTRWNESCLLDFEIPAEIATPLETTRYSYRMWRSVSPSWNVSKTLRAIHRPMFVLVGEQEELLDLDKYLARIPRSRSGMVQKIPRATHLGIVFSASGQWAIANWMTWLSTAAVFDCFD